MYLLLLLMQLVHGDEICNVDRRLLGNNNLLEFPDYPVVYIKSNSNNRLVDISSQDYLREHFGEELVVLSSANAYSHDKLTMTLTDYIQSFVAPSENKNANESYYLFGNNYGGVWKDISDAYTIPNCAKCEQAGAKTVGIAGRHSGVSFHYHGPGFAEVIHGRKQWFLYPPEVMMGDIPDFHPNTSMLQWTQSHSSSSYSGIDILQSQREVSGTGESVDGDRSGGIMRQLSKPVSELLYVCTLHPNEIIYFPTGWLHGTLNLDEYNVFISTFIDPQLL